MVAGFRRSLSLPGPNPNSPGRRVSHVRSTSLPCRSHPIISQVEDKIRAVRLWQSRPYPESGSPAWLCAGMVRLQLLTAAVGDLLQIPGAHDSLRSAASTERLMDDFLRLADAHGVGRTAVVALKQHQSAAQVAIRRRDEARLASCVRSHRRVEKELAGLASAIRDVARSPPSKLGLASNAGEAEIAGIMREAATVAASASAAVFSGVAAASSAVSEVVACLSMGSSSSMGSWMVGPLRRLSSPSSKKRVVKEEEEDQEGGEAWRRRSNALQRLEEMEEWVGALESRSERVFRGLVNTRVFLLNILSAFSL